MNQEQLKNSFPQMPDFIRTMIKEEVTRQIASNGSELQLVQLSPHLRRTNKINKGRSRRMPFFRNTLTRVAAAIFALCICGTTAYAAVKLYIGFSMQGQHAADIQLSGGELPSEGASTVLPEEVPVVVQNITYLSEGLRDNTKAEGEPGFISETEDYGFFIEEPLFADSADPLHVAFLQEIEQITINGREALYTSQNYSSDPDWLWQRVYVLYPEVHRIVSVVGWGYAPREELLRIAEGIELTGTDEMISASALPSWSEAVQNLNTQYAQITGSDETVGQNTARLTATEEEMKGMHRIGEQFAVSYNDSIDGSLLAAVTDIGISDDLSPLTNTDRIQDNWLSLIDENGMIGSATYTYFRRGDGKESMNEVVRTEEHGLKLVYVTVEYTNSTSQDMHEVWYFSGMMSLDKTGDIWRVQSDVFDDGTYGKYLDHAMIGACEMPYSDVTGGERSNNYIPEIKAGETATVHMAWLMEEVKLDSLYLSINADSGYEFTDAILATGLVDLRR